MVLCLARRLGKRKQQPREEYMLKEREKIDAGIFEPRTMVRLGKFFNKGVVSGMGHIIARGKEADIYLAEPGASGKVKDMAGVVLKIFRIETSSFYKMADYINGDPRFSKVSSSKYGIVMEWCRKEYGNMVLARGAHVNVPLPIMFNGNILAMEFIGTKTGTPAPRLKEAMLDDPAGMLDAIMAEARKLYSAGLVHGDLSEYNVLVADGKPYIIDFGQAVMLKHPKSPEFLERDVRNVLQYFRRAYGIETGYAAAIATVTGQR